jgi:hypothetical protein
MEDTITVGLTNKGLAPSTIKSYVNRWNKIDKMIDVNDVDKTVEFLNNKYSKNTAVSYLGTISTIMEILERPQEKQYRKIMEQMKLNNDHKPSDELKQKVKNNMISWDELLELQKKKQNKMKPFKTMSVQAIDDKTIWDKTLEWIVLSLYTLIPPRRNQDYMLMDISKKNDNLTTDRNWYVSKGNGTLIFNVYKTSKTEGQLTIDLTHYPLLHNTLKTYIKYFRTPLMKHRNETHNRLLIEWTATPLEKDNRITRILNNATGMKIGSAQLRRIYITEKYGDTHTQQDKDAKLMGHKTSTQQHYNHHIDE